MPNAQQTLAGGLHGKTGSFYVTDLDAQSRREAHAFSTAAAAPSVCASVVTVAQTALGGASGRVFGKRFKWSPETCAMLGQNISRRVVTDIPNAPALLLPAVGSKAGKYAGDILTRMVTLFGTGGFIRYGLLLPDGLIPDTIEGSSGLLFAGSDFSVYPGMLVTNLDPSLEFPDGYVTVVAGTAALPVPGAYPVGAMGAGSVYRRMFYSRSGQSVWAFEKAAAEAAGLFVCRGSDVVTDIIEVEEGAIYFWASGAYDAVNYPHRRLAIGTKVEDGTIISSYIGEIPHPGFRIVECQFASDFNGLSWDVSMLNPAIGVIHSTDSDYAANSALILSKYRGRLLLVRPGGAVLADPARMSALKSFIRRHRPISSVAIIESRP